MRFGHAKALFFATALFAPGCAALPAQAELVSSAGAEINSLDWVVTGAAITLRANQEEAPLVIQGTAGRLRITQFWLNETRLHQPNGHLLILPPQIERRNLGELKHVFLSISAAQGFAVVIATDSLAARGETQTKIHGAVVAPLLRGTGNQSTEGQSFLPGEGLDWRLPASRLRISLNTTQTSAEGNGTIYWFGATLLLRGAHEMEFSARSRQEWLSSSVEILRAVWYEALVEDINLSVAAPKEITRIYGAGAHSIKGRSLAVDHPRNVRIQGQLPNATGQSWWLNGTFGVQLEALPSRRDALPSYHLAFAGDIRQTSTGGGKPTLLDVSSLPAFPAAVLALAAVITWLRYGGGLTNVLIPLYTKLRRDDVLRVPARESLFRAIRESPGIHFLELRKVVGEKGTLVAFGALAYHLSQLEKFQLVTSKRAGRYRRYFETATVGGDAARLALLKTAPIPLVARVVLARPGANQAELHGAIQAELPVTRQALAYHLRRLEERELVVRETQGRFAHYRPTERLLRLSSHLERAAVPDSTPKPTSHSTSAPAGS